MAGKSLTVCGGFTVLNPISLEGHDRVSQRRVSRKKTSISRRGDMRLPILLKEQTLWQRPSNFMLSPTSGKADGKHSSGGLMLERIRP